MLSSLLPRLRARVSRMRIRRPHGAAGGSKGAAAPEPLLQAGAALRTAREQQGLSLRQLALDTRISTAVLEALERGWRDRLPEVAYLRTMLPLLEQHLDLPAGSLEGALPPERLRPSGPRRGPMLRRFTPGSIDVFTSWEGTLLYGLLILALLYAVNLQQRSLADQGLLAARPMAPLASDVVAVRSGERAQSETLLRGWPELSPLRQAARGQALSRLQAEARRRGEVDLSLGQLSLDLGAPTRLELRSPRGGDTRLDAVQGALSLPVLPPFRLTLQPAAQAGTVRWNGKPLLPDRGGIYRFPPEAPPLQSPQAERRP
ncbi:MAG: helix-turn-helix transcriptional regulator [Synechococcaceae cyanobacterium]|nr:helix-turn-helix transcriptional regulator [Synechococcaceae cyanobacterium]